MGTPPSRLSQYPWVIVRIACKLCTRRGQYRLVRLAARFGPEIELDRLLAHLASDCPYWRDRPRKYDPRCGARYIDLDHNLPPADAREPVVRQRQPAREDLPRQLDEPERITMLSQWPSNRIVIICEVCQRRDEFETAAIKAATPGGDAPLTELLASLTSSCRRRQMRETFSSCAARLAPD